MGKITTLAIDLAKTVFELYGVDGRGVCVLRRQVRRGQLLRVVAQLAPEQVAMEACASAHYWGRQIRGLRRSSFRRSTSGPMCAATRMIAMMPRRSVKRRCGRACRKWQ